MPSFQVEICPLHFINVIRVVYTVQLLGFSLSRYCTRVVLSNVCILEASDIQGVAYCVNIFLVIFT